MQLPPELRDQMMQQVPGTALKGHSRELSRQYLQQEFVFTSEQQRFAYLHVRLPATFAALVRVLQITLERLPSLSVTSLADIGAGPGTGLWAVRELFPALKEVVAYERDAQWIEWGKRLSKDLTGILKKWVHTDLTQQKSFESQDLVLASYSLCEIPAPHRALLLLRLWEATKKVLILIEPGTPRGFALIREVREQLLAQGAHIVAPCPHAQKCPIAHPDWCHFAARVERSSQHRQIKEGTLNFEDEKFSYLVVARDAPLPIQGRIVRHPQKRSGFVSLQVCHKDAAVKQINVSRKSKDEYRAMRKAEWGDGF